MEAHVVEPPVAPLPRARDGVANATKRVAATMKLVSFTRSATAPEMIVAQVAANIPWKRKSVQ
jgi:hypothetical protein